MPQLNNAEFAQAYRQVAPLRGNFCKILRACRIWKISCVIDGEMFSFSRQLPCITASAGGPGIAAAGVTGIAAASGIGVKAARVITVLVI